MLRNLIYTCGRLIVLGWPRERYGITRATMYRRLAEVGANLPVTGRVLSVSHSESLSQVMGVCATEVVHADYPEHNMLLLGFPDKSFDCVVSDQVLEHIGGSPQQAIDESFRVLKPGGVAVHTTCLINPIHNVPGDFWRFTPDGLAMLCRGHGEVVDVGQWGNRRTWLYVALGLRHEPVPRWRWHPLQQAARSNNPAWPIVTWIVVRKH